MANQQAAPNAAVEEKVLPCSTSLTDAKSRMGGQMAGTHDTFLNHAKRLPRDLWGNVDQARHVLYDLYYRTTDGARILYGCLVRDVHWKIQASTETHEKQANILLAETYFWTACCVLGNEIGVTIGSLWMLKALMGSTLHWFNAMLLALLVVPGYAYALLRTSPASDDTKRTWTFGFSVIIGILTGFAVGPHRDWPPPLFVLPSLLGAFALWHSDSSTICLENTYGLATVVIVGFVTQILSVSTWPHFSFHNFVIGLVCAATFVDAQLKQGRLKRRWAAEPLEQWISILVIILPYGLFGYAIIFGLLIMAISYARYVWTFCL